MNLWEKFIAVNVIFSYHWSFLVAHLVPVCQSVCSMIHHISVGISHIRKETSPTVTCLILFELIRCCHEVKRGSICAGLTCFPLLFFSHAIGSVSGGRSRLHLIDLGSCEKVLSKSRDGGGGLCLSLNALGNVIMALANGAKHVPYR